MNTVANDELCIMRMDAIDDSIIEEVADGRTISISSRGPGAYRKGTIEQ